MRGMQAVILAAGRGSRMKNLTEEIPKPMLELAGKTLLEHKFDVLPAEVDEIIIVIGYRGETIQKKFGSSYKGKKITYMVQDALDGTAGALWRVRPLLKDKFLVMMGDDIYSAKDIAACALHEWALLVDKVSGARSSGRVEIDTEGDVTTVEEGEHEAEEWWSCTNMFALDTRIFSEPPIPKAPGSNEFGLPQTVLAASRGEHIPLKAVPATFWIQITSPEDLESAEKALKNQAFKA